MRESGYSFARSLLGLHEIKDRKQLIDLFKKYAVGNDIVLDPQQSPWCAAFMNACERQAGNSGTGSCLAKSFMKYGKKVDPLEAQPGDIVVFVRGGSKWQGHVAYYDGIDKDKEGNSIIRTIGGNQSDSVSVGWYPIRRLIAVRRPD